MRFRSGFLHRGGRRAQRAFRLALGVLVSGGSYMTGMGFAPLATPILLLVPLPGVILSAETLAMTGFWLLLTAGVIVLALGPGGGASWLFVFGLPACSVSAVAGRLRLLPWPAWLCGLSAW
jgi:hypothetical protein